MQKSTFRLFLVALVFSSFAGYSFMNAATTWTAPGSAAPGNNVDTPINIGGEPQDKAGALGVDGLAVFGVQTIVSENPILYFSNAETGAVGMHIRNTPDSLIFSPDRNNDGTISTGETKPALQMKIGDTEDTDFAKFNNQVRSPEYCNSNGTKCVTIDQIIDGLNTDSDSTPSTQNGSVPMGQLSYTDTSRTYGGTYYFSTPFLFTPVIVGIPAEFNQCDVSMFANAVKVSVSMRKPDGAVCSYPSSINFTASGLVAK
jgi:hypothetical protein